MFPLSFIFLFMFSTLYVFCLFCKIYVACCLFFFLVRACPCLVVSMIFITFLRVSSLLAFLSLALFLVSRMSYHDRDLGYTPGLTRASYFFTYSCVCRGLSSRRISPEVCACMGLCESSLCLFPFSVFVSFSRVCSLRDRAEFSPHLLDLLSLPAYFCH